MPAWSYTALTSFETCPRKHYHTRVKKDVHEAEGAALLLGSAAHKALELRIADGTPIPKTVQVTTKGGDTAVAPTTGWEEMIQKIIGVSGDVFTEKQIALDNRLVEVSWYDKTAWVRGVIDVGVKSGSKVLALDYKTGKRKPGSEQLELFAALVMAVWPDVEEVKTGFIWLKTNQIDVDGFTRAQLPEIWDKFNARVKRLEIAHADNRWEPKPSGLCRAWCAVRSCEFNGDRG